MNSKLVIYICACSLAVAALSGCTEELKGTQSLESSTATTVSPTPNPTPNPVQTPNPNPAPPLPPAPLPAPFDFSAPNQGVDLRRYFPSEYTQNISRHADGSLYSDYRFYRATPALGSSFLELYQSLFNLFKPGAPHVWEKRYGAAHDTCIATYAQLFMGDDLSVTEAGDWYAADGCRPDVAFGYGTPDGLANSGLAWSAAGGLSKTQPGFATELNLKRQLDSGGEFHNYGPDGYRAWNKTVMVETLATFTPEFGRSITGQWGPGLAKTYINVIRIVLYHGTRQPGQTPISCAGNIDPAWPAGAQYLNYPGYHSYASEFYMAPGKGIIQEAFLYTENGTYWNLPNCVGLSTESNHAAAKAKWISYID